MLVPIGTVNNQGEVRCSFQQRLPRAEAMIVRLSALYASRVPKTRAL